MQKGDHLFVHRSLLGPTAQYTHHGVYIGNDLVIHYAGYANGIRNRSNRKVERISLEAFAGGQVVQVFHHRSGRLPHEQAAERANHRLGEDRYNLVFNNCEHFANWCCLGEPSSPQVISALKKVTTTSAAGVGVMLTRTVTGQRVVSALVQATRKAALTNPYALGLVTVIVAAGLGYATIEK
jgi:hypothetical protein